MHLFLATDLTAGKATPMDDERIEIRWFQEGAGEADPQGKIEDGKPCPPSYSRCDFTEPRP
jgi:ADP-ribose pyrophosphatase